MNRGLLPGSRLFWLYIDFCFLVFKDIVKGMEIGDHSGSLQEIINLTENLDCYDIYPDIHDHDDLGRYYIEELDAMQVPEHLRNYIDYEATAGTSPWRRAASLPTWVCAGYREQLP